MKALEVDSDNKKAALGVETASVKYAEELLAGELSIEDCNELLNTLEDSYEIVSREPLKIRL